MGRMHMSTKELDRLQAVEKVCNKEIKLNKAAKLLNISTRQAKRLKKQYQRDGVKGIISKKVGAPSNNQLPQEKKDLVIKFLNQEEHKDFGPLLVHEYLSKEHTEFMSASSVRFIMIEYVFWTNKKTKAKNISIKAEKESKRGACTGRWLRA